MATPVITFAERIVSSTIIEIFWSEYLVGAEMISRSRCRHAQLRKPAGAGLKSHDITAAQSAGQTAGACFGWCPLRFPIRHTSLTPAKVHTGKLGNNFPLTQPVRRRRMAINLYLQIDGIKGESSDDRHKDWIECSYVEPDLQARRPEYSKIK